MKIENRYKLQGILGARSPDLADLKDAANQQSQDVQNLTNQILNDGDEGFGRTFTKLVTVVRYGDQNEAQ